MRIGHDFRPQKASERSTTNGEGTFRKNGSSENSRPLQDLVALRYFSITRYSGSNDSLLSFLERCPNLQRIEFHDMQYWTLSPPPLEFLEVIPDLLPKLEELVWDVEMDEPSDAILDAILKLSRLGWKRLEIVPPLRRYSPLLVQALLMPQTVSRIEFLVIQGSLHRQLVQRFLESATNLKSFQGLTRPKEQIDSWSLALTQDWLYDPKEKSGTDPTKVVPVPKPWACAQTLEYLAILIDRVPRSDVLYYFDGSERDLDSETFFWTMQPALERLQQAEWDAHRRGYTQLESLVHLKELIMGHSEADPATTTQYRHLDDPDDDFLIEAGSQRRIRKIIRRFHYGCLSFSLESGLDMLKGMKEMRVLDVSWTAHRIGVKELEWMHIHWPKLKRIDGLMGYPGWADKEFQIEVQEKVSRWVEEHPHGIGCSYY